MSFNRVIVATALVAAAITPDGSSPTVAAHYWAWTAAGVGFAAYVIGFVLSFFLPEPPPEMEH